MKLTLARSRAVTAALVFFNAYIMFTSKEEESLDIDEETVMRFYDAYARSKKEMASGKQFGNMLQIIFGKDMINIHTDDEFLSAVKEEVRNIIRGLLATWTVEKPNK